MATSFWGEGNIGTKPEFKEIANGNNEPYRLLRLNVYFDNPIPKSDGEYEDRGGYWAGVEVWHKDAERYSELYCKGMRVLVIGRMLMDKWEDDKGVECRVMKVQASRVGILPHRVESLSMMVPERPVPAPEADEPE
ncbi:MULTISPECIES: single-stranded DNA-binding protein [unclassified Pseudomonas]|uniref:single-stranded DNA-binding protein n=1 Tax=unclassified Pseudomonas TaxID=196821 RepID=UPI000C2FC078|nr:MULTISPECIES: single-stranded DNA-binding protein [unclassified Pseudomonas]MCU1738485.1 single-stranded DNA-binding protein [Pseudomonas sp. 20S_6.2_Bac1]